MFENFFAKFGQGGELVGREWFGIYRGEEIFNEPSYTLEYSSKARKRALKGNHLLLMKSGWNETPLTRAV